MTHLAFLERVGDGVLLPLLLFGADREGAALRDGAGREADTELLGGEDADGRLRFTGEVVGRAGLWLTG